MRYQACVNAFYKYIKQWSWMQCIRGRQNKIESKDAKSASLMNRLFYANLQMIQ